MPKNKKRIAAVGLAAYSVISLCAAGTLAYWRSEGISENRLTTGILDGTIVGEYIEPQGGLYPGDTVDRVVNVRNDGTLDMVVRVKVEKGWTDSSNPALDSEKILIDFDTTNWLDGGDGYYYYKGILTPGETTAKPLMDSFILDRSASNEYMDQEASIDISMECLQAASNAIENVWGISYEELGVDEPQGTETQNAVIEFTDKNTFAFSTGNDLFGSFKNLTPGETRYQTIDIKNSSMEEIGMFLSAQLPSGIDELLQSFLREYAVFIVTDEDGNILYSGAADGSSATGEISLGSFLAGESRTLNVALSIDPQAGNEYQNLEVQNIQWVFTAQGEDKEISGTPGGGNGASLVPITGDDSVIIFWIAASGVATAMIAILLWVFGKERKKHKGNA